MSLEYVDLGVLSRSGVLHVWRIFELQNKLIAFWYRLDSGLGGYCIGVFACRLMRFFRFECGD